ncbi:hypothetical protein A4G99_22500 [Haladaptatus sp. R4]|uniref:hypothetical protein n=1 Tax=Haladaptatus sp. R4 TaxID=1679489 RepID=UPI0007B4701B|nr:hypothetical protein [Haladaptatus sp. R4]KZN26203.1 hypothetical protein A4G99_22500 [Haladaptatus sp. R4]
MGLFKNMGRKFEEFKKTSEEVASEGAEYECSDCGKLLYTNHDECPECGGTVGVREEKAAATAEEEARSADDVDAAGTETDSADTTEE